MIYDTTWTYIKWDMGHHDVYIVLVAAVTNVEIYC